MAYISFQPKDYFNTKLYTGNGTDDHAITGVGFQPDFVWHKIRSGADNHGLYDAIRGATKNLQSNSNYAEQTTSTGLKSFDSDGFTLGTNGEINGNSSTYASWNWKANGAGSSNTDGSINTTYTSVNTTAGFSIASFTSPASGNFTFGHGLGVAPNVVILKTTGATSDWSVFHSTVCDTVRKYLSINTTSALTTHHSDLWGASLPTSSVMGATSGQACVGSQSCIAYCFAEKKGFSKFGSYTGNGNADGSFIYTGFKPAFVLTKNTSTASDWILNDNKRLGYNPNNYRFKANDTVAEQTVTDVDLLSNGFKLYTTSTDHNVSGNTYIYMAFAEAPLVSSNGVPAVAR